MPVTRGSTPTVSVQVPVPTPVAPAKRPPVAFAPTAPPPQPVGPTGVPPVAPPTPQLSAVIVPWAPPAKAKAPTPTQMRRVKQAVRYSKKGSVLTWRTFDGKSHTGQIIDVDNGTVIVRMPNGRERAVRCDQPESKHIVDRATMIAANRKSRLPRRVMKYGRPEGLDHSPFLSKMIENTREHTPQLVYADWLEENGQPHLAEFIREVVTTQQNSSSYSMGRSANTLHVRYGPASADDIPKVTASVYAYMGNGQFRERRGNRKPPPTVNVSVKSPDPSDPSAALVHSIDVSPNEAHEWMKRLVSEGHPTGNEARSSALQRAVSEAKRDNPPPTEPPAQMSRLPRRVVRYSQPK